MADVQVVLKGIDEVSGVLGDIQGGLLGFSAAAAAAGLAITGIAFTAGHELDNAFDTIIIGTGASGDALDGLKDSFRDVFAEVPADAATVSSILSELNTRLGLTGDDLETLAVPLLDVTRMLGGDAQTNAALFSRVIGDWAIPVEESTTLLDKMFSVSQSTGIGIDRLSEKVVQFGSPMRLMGFSIEESIALFGKWEKEGVNAELVMGSLRIAAGHFAREGVDLQDGLWNTVDAIQNAASSSEGLAIAMEIFGARAGPDMAAAILEGRFNIEDLMTTMAGSQGVISETSEATLDWAEKLDILRNRATLALEPLGGWLLDGANSLLTLAIPAFDSFVQSINKTWAELVTMWNESKHVADVMGILKGIFDDVSAQVVPFLLEQFEKLNAWYIENEELIKDFRDVVIEAFRAIAPVVGQVVGIILPLLDGVIDIILGLAKVIMQVATGDWSGAWATIKGVANSAMTAIVSALKAFFDMIARWFGSSGDEVIAVWTGNFNLLREITGRILSIIAQTIGNELDKARRAFDGIFNQIERLIDWFGKLARAVANFRMPDMLTPGSPTPFEIGLRGINDAMREINASSFPKFSANFGGMEGLSPSPFASNVSAASASGITVVINYQPAYSTASADEMQAFVPVVENALRKIRGYE